MTIVTAHPDHESYLRAVAFEQNCASFRKYVLKHTPTAKPLDVSIRSVFAKACEEVPSISANRSILGGTPCITGTRIPVYMVLQAVCHYGTVEGALQWYPDLNTDNVRDALKFSGLVMECPVDNQVESAS